MVRPKKSDKERLKTGLYVRLDDETKLEINRQAVYCNTTSAEIIRECINRCLMNDHEKWRKYNFIWERRES